MVVIQAIETKLCDWRTEALSHTSLAWPLARRRLWRINSVMVASDSINHTYNDPIPPPHSHTQELDTKAWIQWCVQRDFMERKQMLLEHSLGRSVRCCDVWRVILVQRVKNLPAVQETWVWSLGQEDPLEKGMAIHSSILAWRIPWAEESGSLWSRGSQRVRHDWVTNTLTSFTFFLKSKMLYLTSC